MDAHQLIQSNVLNSASCDLITAEGLIPIPGAPEKSLVFRTSGTSGEEKFIVLKKAGILSSAHCVNGLLGINKTSVLGLILPWWHVGGLGIMARSHTAGCRMAHFQGKWNPQACCEWITHEKVTHLSLVPTQVHDLFTSCADAPKSLRAVVVGGGNLLQNIEFGARELGWPLLKSYGMTEASSQIATQSEDSKDQTFALGEIQVLDCWDVRTNVDGLLEIAGEPLFSGLLEKRADGWEYLPREGRWWTTQDRVSLRGRALRWLGRADDVVKILGELVSLRGVEDALAEAGMTSGTYAVIPVMDERKENVLHLFSEVECGNALSRYHASCAGFARIDFLHQMPLPKSDLGKIRRGELLKALG